MKKHILIVGLVSLISISTTAFADNKQPIAPIKASIQAQPVSAITSVDLGLPVSSASSVGSVTDLETYESTVLKNNTEMVAIDTKSNAQAIAITWNLSKKFLWIIPVTILAKTNVEVSDKQEIKVTTSLPWWNIFVPGANTTIKNIESNLTSSTALKSIVNVSGSSQSKAKVIDVIIAELK